MWLCIWVQERKFKKIYKPNHICVWFFFLLVKSLPLIPLQCYTKCRMRPRHGTKILHWNPNDAKRKWIVFLTCYKVMGDSIVHRFSKQRNYTEIHSLTEHMVHSKTTVCVHSIALERYWSLGMLAVRHISWNNQNQVLKVRSLKEKTRQTNGNRWFSFQN